MQLISAAFRIPDRKTISFRIENIRQRCPASKNKSSGRSVRIKTPDNIAGVKQPVNKSPQRSDALALGISDRNLRKIFIRTWSLIYIKSL